MCPRVLVGKMAHRRRAVAAGFRLLPHSNVLEPNDARRIELANATWRGGGGSGRGASLIGRCDASEWREALNDRRSVL